MRLFRWRAGYVPAAPNNRVKPVLEIGMICADKTRTSISGSQQALTDEPSFGLFSGGGSGCRPR
jgi:hypothetical protein